MGDLSGKHALVCGSSSGIGKACAEELARRGASVTLVARSERSLQAVHGSLAPPEGRPHAVVVADFEDPQAVEKVVERHLLAAGTVHILVNNTGGPPSGAVMDTDPQAFQRAFSMHLVCNQVLARLVVPGMKKADFGRIVNIVSISVREPIPGLGISNTVRAAVANWAKTLAGELAPHGITVNNVLPGYTDTPRLRALIHERSHATGVPEAEIAHRMVAEVPAGRFARPEEIAAAVGFLASPAASYITGVSLAVDGGRIRSH